jgi:HEAT repeat protein
MRSGDQEITTESLVDPIRLRKWSESLGLNQSASALLQRFRQSSSSSDRAIIWNALLEMASMWEEDFAAATFRAWLDELLEALKHKDPGIRRQTLDALWDVAKYVAEDANVLSSVVRSLYDDSESVRGQAISTIDNCASRPLLSLLTASLRDDGSYHPAADDPDQTCVWHALFALDQVVGRLDLGCDERDETANQLFQALLKVLQTPEPSSLDIWKVGDSLGEHVKGNQALWILQEMFAHANPVVRDSAVHGLGHLRGSEAIELINLALKDPAAEVREEAQRARAEIESKF